MAKNLETGKFEQVTGSTDTYFNDKYVDYVYSKEEEEEITSGTGTHFFDATIIPTVQYQVYGLDNVWFWDNEGQNYTFDETTKSTIKIQISEGITSTTKTYYVVDSDALVESTSLTEEQKASATKIDSISPLPDGADENSVYYIETVTEILTPSDGQVTPASPYEFNKYGKEPYGKVAVISISPAQALAGKYPYAIVTINGKEYDLNYLATFTKDGQGAVTEVTPKPIRLVMDKDYRISINWVWGSIVETFRIICNR